MCKRIRQTLRTIKEALFEETDNEIQLIAIEVAGIPFTKEFFIEIRKIPQPHLSRLLAGLEKVLEDSQAGPMFEEGTSSNPIIIDGNNSTEKETAYCVLSEDSSEVLVLGDNKLTKKNESKKIVVKYV